MDALQKLKTLLLGYCKTGTNRSHGEQMANSRRKGEKSRDRFIHRYKNLYFGAYLVKYAYTVFSYYDDSSHLRLFIDDAYHFVYDNKDLVRDCPLQLYYTAITFEDTQSAIFTSFQQIIQTEFKNAPTSIRLPQRRVSLVRNIELKGRGSIALLYSPDSFFLCSLSMGGIVSFFRTDIYAPERVIELDINRSLSDLDRHFLAFSIDSKHLVSISGTGIVQVWTVDCGTQVQKLTLNLSTRLVQYDGQSILQEEVIAISKFGELAASTCRALSGALISVKVWEIKTGKCSIVIDRSQMCDISYAIFSPNLRMIALIDDEVARVYSVQTGKDKHHITYTTRFEILFRRKARIHARFSPNSKLLEVKCGFNTCLWCTETWTMVRQMKCRLSDVFSDAALSVCNSSYDIFLSSIDTGEILPIFRFWGRNLIFSPDWTQSSLFAASSYDAIQIWRAFIDTRAKSFDVQNTFGSEDRIAISPKSKYVAVWDDGGSIQIWSGESGECTQVLQGERIYCNSPFFSPDLELVACVQGIKGDIQIWHVRTGKPLHLLKGPGTKCYYVPTDFSDDSRYIVARYSTGQARVWCVESGKSLFENILIENTFIWKVAFSPGSRYIATILCPIIDLIPTVCTWDSHTGHCISRIQLEGESSFSIISLAFSLDAKVLVVISRSEPSYLSCHPCKARFYDVASCACLGHIDISESNGPPIFDPAKDHIVAGGFIYCKGSSWKDWDTISQPEKYHLVSWRRGETHVCLVKHNVFHIPKHILPVKRDQSMSISNSLLVFLNYAKEVVIIKLPDRDYIEQ
jgi:WD40 repeat protein